MLWPSSSAYPGQSRPATGIACAQPRVLSPGRGLGRCASMPRPAGRLSAYPRQAPRSVWHSRSRRAAHKPRPNGGFLRTGRGPASVTEGDPLSGRPAARSPNRNACWSGRHIQRYARRMSVRARGGVADRGPVDGLTASSPRLARARRSLRSRRCPGLVRALNPASLAWASAAPIRWTITCACRKGPGPGESGPHGRGW
jgi:hypothetical protein